MKTTTVELKGKIMPWATRFILLLGMILFLAACASKAKVQEGDAETLRAEWTKEVRKVIKDPERAEKVIDLGVQVETKSRILYEEINRLKQEMRNVNRNYDSRREDYERALGEFTDKKNEALRQYLDSLFAMRQQTTPKEWKALMK